MNKSLTVAASLSVLLVASAAGAADRHPRHHHHGGKSDRLHVPAVTAYSPYVDDRAPAHMVEVRPGLWISSYGCVVDEGYGRLRNCSDVRIGR